MTKKTLLTDAKANAVKPRKREMYIWDKDIPGFGLRVRPKGSKRFIYLKDGKKITLAASSADESRAECLRLRLDRNANDNSGNAVKKITFGEYAATEWKKRCHDRYAVKTKSTSAGYMKNHILPHFGDRYLHEITRREIQKWFDMKSRHRGGAANMCLGYVNQILCMAKRDGLIEINPARGIKPNSRKPMMRFLSAEERARLFDVLAQREKALPRSRVASDIVRLLMLTGCRRSEITGLEWAWIRDGQIHMPRSKTGGKIVWISKEAEAIIRQQPKTNSAFVFPDPNDPTRCHPFSCQHWYAMRRMAGLEDVRLHDLRHSFASHAIQQGVPLPVLSKLLGHASLKMTLRYAHVSDADVEAAAERVGARIADLLGE